MESLATLPDRIRSFCDALAAGRIDTPAFLEGCCRIVAADMGCSRTGVWHFMTSAHGERVLRALAMYDAVGDRMVHADDTTDVGAYFLALVHTGYVNACDIGSHFATAGPFAQRLGGHGVQSLLAATLAVNGRVFGTVTCTQVDRQVEWSQWQVSTLRRVAGRMAVPLLSDPTGLAAPSADVRGPFGSTGGA